MYFSYKAYNKKKHHFINFGYLLFDFNLIILSSLFIFFLDFILENLLIKKNIFS